MVFNAGHGISKQQSAVESVIEVFAEEYGTEQCDDGEWYSYCKVDIYESRGVFGREAQSNTTGGETGLRCGAGECGGVCDIVHF